MEQVSLGTVLPQLQTRYGLEVRQLHGEHAEKLVKEYGGLLGLTRY